MVGRAWRTSSRCESSHCVQVGVWTRSARCESAQCVEVGASGRRITRCEASQCVEVDRPGVDRILMRDSKDPAGPVLDFGADAWRAFLAGTRR
jgi:hypothetical protein